MFDCVTSREKWLMVVSAVGCILGFFAILGLPAIINEILKNNIVLEEGTEAWDRFVEFPLPINFKVHFFEVENQDEVLKGIRPILKEIGPYVYKTFRNKINITKEGEFVSYYQMQRFEFDYESTPSDITPDDNITSVNALLMGMYQILETSCTYPALFENLDEIMKFIFEKPDVFYTVKAKDLLLDGVEFCKPQDENLQAKLVCMLVMFMNFKMVDYREDLTMAYSLFGFKNNHHDGLYKMNTGTKDVQKVGEIFSLNNMEYTKFWRGEKTSCDKVEGLDSTIYPPHIEEGDSFKIYASDICRTASLSYSGHSKFKDLKTYNFRMDDNIFRPKPNEKNEDSCFCINKTRGMDGEPTCFLDGVLDVQTCLGIPGVVSLPHFLNADEKYSNAVIGLNASFEKHGTDMDMQPFTGIPLRGQKRIQINLVVRPAELDGTKVNATKDISKFLLPILWIEEGVDMTDEYFDIINSALTIIDAIEIIKWVLLAVSIVLLVAPMVFIFYRRRK